MLGILESLDPGLCFGPGNAGLWTDISGNIGPKTHKTFRPETHRSKVIYHGPNSVCFWAEISVQSPAFLGPKSRPRVKRFQNAHFKAQMIHLLFHSAAQYLGVLRNVEMHFVMSKCVEQCPCVLARLQIVEPDYKHVQSCAESQMLNYSLNLNRNEKETTKHCKP